MKKLLFLFIASGIFGIASSQEAIKPEEAKNYVGQKVTVCGKVVSASYEKHETGKPTFLNLDKPFPYHEFSIVIWINERELFEVKPEKYFLDKKVCVTGEISMYKGKAQIELKAKEDIKTE